MRRDPQRDASSDRRRIRRTPDGSPGDRHRRAYTADAARICISMDNITHTLTGLMLARAGLGRTTPRGGSLMMMLAANAPDLDVFLGLPGGLAYMEYHRGYAHSLFL